MIKILLLFKILFFFISAPISPSLDDTPYSPSCPPYDLSDEVDNSLTSKQFDLVKYEHINELTDQEGDQ